MSRMSKKTRIVAAAIVAVIVCVLFMVGYIAKHKDSSPEPEAPASKIVSTETKSPLLDTPPDESWEDDDKSSYNGFTTRAQLGAKEGSIGVLTIEKIGVSVHVFDSDDNSIMEDMKKGAAHYRTTSYWDGNIGIAAHIGNTDYCYFERLRELKQGDTITYETELGTRSYTVTEIVTIGETDWSRLERTEDNRITLTTCIGGQPAKRLCVQGVEV